MEKRHSIHRRWKVSHKAVYRVRRMLCALFVVSLALLVGMVLRYRRDQETYRALQELVITQPAPTATPLPEPQPAKETAEPLPTPPIQMDFEKVWQEASRVRAWLYSEGTVINYPVCCYANNSYFLDRDHTGAHNKSGALFFDAAVGKQLLGENLIIYGHRMKDGSMFRSILNYHKQDYYEAHPNMYLLTPEGNYRYDIFSARYSDTDIKSYPIWFADEAAREKYVHHAINNSLVTVHDTAFYPNRRMLTLVTCAYSDYMDDARFIVQGWLVPIGN